MTRAMLAHIGIGSNVGDRAATVHRAFAALAALPHTRLVACSPVYETMAEGPIAQGAFLNAAAAIETLLTPADLLAHLLDIERREGRDRSRQAQRWGPRTLDLDILLYDTAHFVLPGLTIPHPRLHERAFVLVPLADIAADASVPGIGRRVRELRDIVLARGGPAPVRVIHAAAAQLTEATTR